MSDYTDFERSELEGYYISSNAPASGRFYPVDYVQRLEAELESYKAVLDSWSNETIKQLEAENAELRREVERYRDALDHISRTCNNADTATRRIQWIEQRCQSAIHDNEDWKSLDLPKNRSRRYQEYCEMRMAIKEIAPWLSASLSELTPGHDGTYEAAVNRLLEIDIDIGEG